MSFSDCLNNNEKLMKYLLATVGLRGRDLLLTDEGVLDVLLIENTVFPVLPKITLQIISVHASSASIKRDLFILKHALGKQNPTWKISSLRVSKMPT